MCWQWRIKDNFNVGHLVEVAPLIASSYTKDAYVGQRFSLTTTDDPKCPWACRYSQDGWMTLIVWLVIKRAVQNLISTLLVQLFLTCSCLLVAGMVDQITSAFLRFHDFKTFLRTINCTRRTFPLSNYFFFSHHITTGTELLLVRLRFQYAVVAGMDRCTQWCWISPSEWVSPFNFHEY